VIHSTLKREVAEAVQQDPTVRRVYDQGYRISYKAVGDHRIDVTAEKGQTEIGWVTFEIVRPSGSLRADSVRVMKVTREINFRRKGVGNALCVAAELVTGCIVVSVGPLAEDGKAFWDQPRRPWGNPRPSVLPEPTPLSPGAIGTSGGE
jgi:hypothetical protein